MNKSLKFIKRFFVGGFLLLTLGILNGHAQTCLVDPNLICDVVDNNATYTLSKGVPFVKNTSWAEPISTSVYIADLTASDMYSFGYPSGAKGFEVGPTGSLHITYNGTDPLTIYVKGSGKIYMKSDKADVTIIYEMVMTGDIGSGTAKFGKLILDGASIYTLRDVQGHVNQPTGKIVINTSELAVNFGTRVILPSDVDINQNVSIFNRGFLTIRGNFVFNGAQFLNFGEMLVTNDFTPVYNQCAAFLNRGRVRIGRDMYPTEGQICLSDGGCFTVDGYLFGGYDSFGGIMGDGGLHVESGIIYGWGRLQKPLIKSGHTVQITYGESAVAKEGERTATGIAFANVLEPYKTNMGVGTFLKPGTGTCGGFTSAVEVETPNQYACANKTVQLKVFPQNSVYLYKWFKSNGAGGWIVQDGDNLSASGVLEVTKGSGTMEVYAVDVYDMDFTRVYEKKPVHLYLKASGECNDFYAVDVMACEGDNVRLNIFPQKTTLTYEWFKSNGAGGWISQGVHANGYFDVVKGSASLESYAVDVRESSNVEVDKFPVNLYLSADTLIWTGTAGNGDWNNAANWNYPGIGTLSGKPEFWIPRPCTNVLIPAGIGNYPDLNNTSTGIYSDAACNRIWFRHGGEVVRTDLLNYKKANVELTLAANRWNMISAPLRYMYTGDFYKNDPCPHADKLRIYQQLFAMKNPQTDATVNPTGGWTGPFNNPEIAIPAGSGYAVHLLDDGTAFDDDFNKMPVANETDWVPATGRHSIWFPKNDKTYNVYWLTSVNGDKKPPINGSCESEDIKSTHTIGRGSGFDNYRFVYESGSTWNTTGNITLTTSDASAAEEAVIVGNPFMSHWDFDKFAIRNTGKFKDEYKVLESGNDAVYVTYSSLISSNKLIAPMQSILITSSAAFGTTDLKTNVEDMAQNPGDKLKSASNPVSNLLKITAEKDGTSNQTHILFDASAGNNYMFEEDSYKLFVTDVTGPIAVYTRSSDGVALDINVFGDTDQLIQLGVRTSQTGNIDLRFEGVENFGKLQLIDGLYPNDVIDLKETPEYSFNKTTSDLFLDGRFFLSFKKAPNSDLIPTEGAVSIFTSGNQLQVVSDCAIDAVQIFDIQGRLLKKATNVRNSCTLDLPQCGVCIVKVLTKESSVVKKVMANK